MTVHTPNGVFKAVTKAEAATSMLGDMIYLERSNAARASPQILPVLGAVTGVISTAIAAGQLGLEAANAANASSGALEVEFRNLGSNVIAPFSFDTNDADMAAFPGPILPGTSDSMVLTQGGGFSTGSSNASLEMLIAGTKASKAIEVKLKFIFSNSSSPGLWQLTATVDGATHDFEAEKGLVGLQFTGTSPFPSFNMYFSSVEAAGGELLVSIYNP